MGLVLTGKKTTFPLQVPKTGARQGAGPGPEQGRHLAALSFDGERWAQPHRGHGQLSWGRGEGGLAGTQTWHHPAGPWPWGQPAEPGPQGRGLAMPGSGPRVPTGIRARVGSVGAPGTPLGQAVRGPCRHSDGSRHHRLLDSQGPRRPSSTGSKGPGTVPGPGAVAAAVRSQSRSRRTRVCKTEALV